MRALIGYTGFVGGNIDTQAEFDDRYNTANIDAIDGSEFDLVVSAATYAEMWKINQDPEGDLRQIEGLIKHLQTLKVRKFVLISTVGVYKNPNGADEDTPIETDDLLPYGKNRYHLEQFCRDNFDTLVVRLPGLYGPGLKKNVIFDLMHNNNTDRIHKDGVYQYYDLGNIWSDIQTALANDLDTINLATPPVSTEEVARHAFGMDFRNIPEDVRPAYWDMHTKHAALYGGPENYLITKEQELDSIKQFVDSQKGKV